MCCQSQHTCNDSIFAVQFSDKWPVRHVCVQVSYAAHVPITNLSKALLYRGSGWERAVRFLVSSIINGPQSKFEDYQIWRIFSSIQYLNIFCDLPAKCLTNFKYLRIASIEACLLFFLFNNDYATSRAFANLLVLWLLFLFRFCGKFRDYLVR